VNPLVFIVAVGSFGIMMTGDARAHDQWADGSEVPAWVKKACCGPEDVHHLRDDQVHLTADGYKVDGYPDLIPVSKALPSPDGTFWIFYKMSDTANGPSYSPVYCFFSPFNGT